SRWRGSRGGRRPGCRRSRRTRGAYPRCRLAIRPDCRTAPPGRAGVACCPFLTPKTASYPLLQGQESAGRYSRSQPEQVIAAVPGVLRLQGALAFRRHQHVALAGPFVDRVLTLPQLAAQRRLADLVGRRFRQARGDPDQPRGLLRAEVGLRAEEGPEGAGVEFAAGDLERRHGLVAGDRVGDSIDGGRGHAWEAAQDLLDRGGREVLRVHAEPVRGAPGEPDEPLLVAVAEVAGPVVTLPQPVPAGLGVVVVALEAGRGPAGDDLADRLLGVGQRAVGVEAGRRADRAVRVDDLHREPLLRDAEGSVGRLRRADEVDGALGRAVGLKQRT